MSTIARIDQIPLAHTIFPPESHPDLENPGPVHHGWNTGRQLLLHAAGSALARPMTTHDQPLRLEAIMQLRALGPNLHEVAGPLTLALHVSAVQQPPPHMDTASLAPLIGEALADLGAWGIRTPLSEQLALITRSVRAFHPCMPD